MSSLFDLSGKKALVTGATRGIGRAIAIGLARAGADVAAAARNEEQLRAVADEVEAAGRRSVVLPTDVTDADAVREMVAQALDGLGGVDILVNNAGGSSFMGPFTDMRFRGWEKVMRLNVESVVHATQALAPHLLERGSGTVINIASVAGLTGSPALAAYGASKAALVSLTKTLSIEWGSAGVRVNALCPGWTATNLNKDLWSNEQLSSALMARVPLARWATAEEMVGPAVFLASDASSYVTGQVLVADGGLTAT
ncbi:MAG TPA: glucose 1-dehydrogenase [Frankiaceae bacterium]|nr:glucose 1-dehydrogenase [Frankiaceae bacterium]